jgi:hypothetical protein
MSGGGAGGSGGSGGWGEGGQSGRDYCDEGFLSNESCNGVDDDCDGEVDELGTFTCGVGVCARTVPACSGGTVSVCRPLAPAATSDGCNGVDDDCDGAVDEDCTGCVPVAPTGNDAMALASSGATPFATVQAAIDFADAHRSLVPRVCVAAGATCGATATFTGPVGADLTMRDGISVLGNYESTAWTRCSTSTTRLAPQTGRGVFFPETISRLTVLDGFAIDRFQATTTAGVTLTGAQNVMLSNLTIVGSPEATNAYGVDLATGARATIFRSRIDSGGFVSEGIAVRSVGSQVFVEDNCPGPPDPTTGWCTGACSSSGAEIRSSFSASSHTLTRLHPILLRDSPGSRIERSAVCSDLNVYWQLGEASAIQVEGDAAGILIRANSVRLQTPGVGELPTRKSTIRFMGCDGASPWIVGNHSLTLTSANDIDGVLEARGDCHPTFEANELVEGTHHYSAWGCNGVICQADGGLSSRCVVTNNSLIRNVSRGGNDGSFQTFLGLGVQCTGESCARIDRNRIVGMYGDPDLVAAQFLSGTGISVAGPAVIADNDIVGVSTVSNRLTTGAGLIAGAARGIIEHNSILGSDFPVATISTLATAPTGLTIAGTADREWIVRSNEIRAVVGSPCGGTNCGGGGSNPYSNPSIGIEVRGTAGVFADNIVSPGGCSTGLAIAEGSFAERHPRLFVNNHLIANTGQLQGALYRDGSAGYLLTAAAVDALTDMTASGTTAELCGAP